MHLRKLQHHAKDTRYGRCATLHRKVRFSVTLGKEPEVELALSYDSGRYSEKISLARSRASDGSRQRARCSS
jgi:hypothetical protein